MMPASPEMLITAAEAGAETYATPSGGGEMIWRRWPASGLPSGRPAVLLHGGSGSWRHWIRNIEALRTDRDVWAPDLPGFGQSASPPEPVGFASVARVVAAGLRSLLAPDQTFDLVGFSFGSHIAVYASAELGPRVATAVLVSGHLLGPMLHQPANMLERWRSIEDAAERDTVLKRNLGALMLAHEASMDPLALVIYATDVVTARIRPAKFINDREFRLVERIACRIGAIAGTLDPLGVPSPAAQAKALMEARSDARVRLIDNAGHWVAYEAPDAFNATLRELLAD